MRIWAIEKQGDRECEIGMEFDSEDREAVVNEIYRIARNLFTGELELFWKDGECGKAF